MKLEGEHAADKRKMAHGIVSGVVYALWTGLAFSMGGLGQALKI